MNLRLLTLVLVTTALVALFAAGWAWDDLLAIG
jgi:hypothetical protein